MRSREFKRIRKALGLSQCELAKVLGRSLRMVKYYEAGFKIPALVSDKLKGLKNE